MVGEEADVVRLRKVEVSVKLGPGGYGGASRMPFAQTQIVQANQPGRLLWGPVNLGPG